MSTSDEISFLPTMWVPKDPDFLVWWTGTLGQAEWLITHSSALRGRSIAMKCPSNLSGIPNKLRPLFALEQPDLLISSAEGDPLLSIEITEQQEFGLNGQQRMARFWSALANKVPSAYLLPLESYQIEKASASDTRLLDESDSELREFLLNTAVLRDVNGASLWRQGIHSHQELLDAIDEGSLPVPPEALESIRGFIADHIDRSGDLAHLPAVSPGEFLHEIDGVVYKIYLRSPRVTTSMLLHWMELSSQVTPTFPFKLQSRSEWMFRTNGAIHTLEDKKYPHLSYRNLLPSPGTSEIVNRRLGRDELQLFVDMVDSVCERERIPDLGRDIFTEPDQLFPRRIVDEWRRKASEPNEVLEAGSSDISCSSTVLRQVVASLNHKASPSLTKEIKNLLAEFTNFHVYKIRCNVTRSLADPYSGVLAVRDVLFCRRTSQEQIGDLTAFKRKEGLVFYVELRGEGALRHTFLEKALGRVYKKLVPDGINSDPLNQLIELATAVRAEQIPKEIRSHVLLPDLIVVNRIKGRSASAEILVGIPHLRRHGLVSKSSKLLESLRI